MNEPKKLRVVNLKFERQKSEPNSRQTVEIPENKNKQNTVCFLCYLLAIRAIDCWLKRSKYPIDVREAVDFLGLKIKAKQLSESNKFDTIDFLQQSVLETADNLHQELEITASQLYKIYFNVNNLHSGQFEVVRHYLDKYTSIAPQKYHLALKTNYQNLQTELDNRFKEVASFWQKASIDNSLNFFQEIRKFLHIFKRKYQQKREQNLDKKNASFRVYRNFLCAIKYKDNQNDFCELQDDISIAKQSLLNSYKFKIEAETYSLAIQALNNLIKTNQMYIEALQECHDFLTKIKARFFDIANILEEDYLFLPLIVAQRTTSDLDLDNLQKKVEIKLNHSFHTPRRYTGVTMDEVQNVLIEEVKPIAKKICLDTYYQLASEVDSFE